MKSLHQFALAALLGASSLAATSNAFAEQPAAPVAEDAMSHGEIRKVDRDSSKLTIKHGALKNLGMPGMTMVFKVKDPAMLEKIQQGDKVRFVAQTIGGALTVTAIEADH